MLLRRRFVGLLTILVSLSGMTTLAHADWRAFTDEDGRVTVRALDESSTAGLLLDCMPRITLITQDAFPAGRSGLGGEYDNGLKFVVEADVPGAEPHTVTMVQADQIEALIRGLTNRHKLVLVDPNGAAYTFDLSGFGGVWREACQQS